MPNPTELYAAALRRLADRTSRGVLVVWDALGDLSIESSLRFHSEAGPLVRAAATVSIDITSAYATTITAAPADPSGLIADEAVAHVFDPFDRYAHLVTQGDEPAAAASARSVAKSLGHDTVYRAARQSIAEMVPDVTSWVRLITGKSCKWCMSLSGVEFRSAADATFGHANCDCVPVPAAAGTPLNARTRQDAGWDDQAAQQYRQRHHRNNLTRQAQTARRRSEQARLEQLTEMDPARRERLSIREQEWETRAERAEERLRILDTGSHLLTR